MEILREQRHAFGVLEEVLIERLELLRGDRLVAGPPHVLVGRRIANGELVLRAAAGEHTGVGAQCAVGGHGGLIGTQRMLIELRRAEIPVHAFEFFETEFVGAEGTVMHARLLHEKPPKSPHRQGEHQGKCYSTRPPRGSCNMAVRPRHRPNYWSTPVLPSRSCMIWFIPGVVDAAKVFAATHARPTWPPGLAGAFQTRQS